jgi:hypothetical protein
MTYAYSLYYGLLVCSCFSVCETSQGILTEHTLNEMNDPCMPYYVGFEKIEMSHENVSKFVSGHNDLLAIPF